MAAERLTIAARWRRIVAPFDRDLPTALRDEVTLAEYRRLHANRPQVCIAVVLTTLAATVALLGDLPWWQQLTPPAILLAGAGIILLSWWRQRGREDLATARRELRITPYRAVFLGAVGGIWAVSAFTETEQYYCVVAPVFIALAALMVANLLSGVPHAALFAVTAAFAPIVIKMMMFDNLGVRAIAIMMVVIALMQLRMIYAKFEASIRTARLEHDLRRLADTDPLTGLDNRRAFDRCVDLMLDRDGATIAIIDLDGFKAANDRHGHAVGDAVLVEVGRRLRQLYPDAASIARLGGDEFAVILPRSAVAIDTACAIRTAVSLPFVVESAIVAISAGVGTATATAGSIGAAALVRAADSALYAEKRGTTSPALATA